MEFLIEILLELVFEVGAQISTNKKVPKWIRYPIIVLILLFFTIIIFGIIALGIYILKRNIHIGVIIILIGLILLVSAVREFKKIYIEKKNNN